MPPKSTPAAKKPAAAKPAAAKPAAAKPAAKSTAAKPTAAKPTAKSTVKGTAPAKTTKSEEKKVEAPPPPQPIVFAEIGIKELDSKVVWDKEGTIKATGKWPTVVDDNGLPARFLRHRDVNMLTVPDEQNMQPETIRKALIGAIKYGKPFILDMMEAEMYEFCKDQFDKILPGLLDMILDKSLVDDTTYSYMQIVKPEDGQEFQNQYDYKMLDFSFMVVSQAAPNEELLRKTYPVKIV